MANPKKRHTRAKRDTRRSQWRISLTSLVKCPQCGEPKKPYYVCTKCGYYANELVKPPRIKKKKEEATPA